MTSSNTESNIIPSKSFSKICKFYLQNKCKKENCTFLHTPSGTKYSNGKKKNNSKQPKKFKNTVCFEPMTRPVDLRIVYDLDTDNLKTKLTDRDLLFVPNLFSKYQKLEIYHKLVSEIKQCEEKNPDLLKLWHGNDKIVGTHLIADDKLNWKEYSPTFKMVLDKLKDYFNVDIKSTRFNWYSNTNQWKPFHFDAAAFDAEKRKTQNITISLSFGCTRNVALEFAEHNKNNTQTTISVPIADGEIYAFTNTTNDLWRHGILKENEYSDEGRISIIIWGWIDNINKMT